MGEDEKEKEISDDSVLDKDASHVFLVYFYLRTEICDISRKVNRRI